MQVISFVDARDSTEKAIFRCFADRPLIDGKLDPKDVDMLRELADFFSQKVGYKLQWIWFR